MTYNVFGGTLSLTQSVNHCALCNIDTWCNIHDHTTRSSVCILLVLNNYLKHASFLKQFVLICYRLLINFTYYISYATEFGYGCRPSMSTNNRVKPLNHIELKTSLNDDDYIWITVTARQWYWSVQGRIQSCCWQGFRRTRFSGSEWCSVYCAGSGCQLAKGRNTNCRTCKTERR